MSEPEIIVDTNIRINLSAEELYQEFLVTPYLVIYVLKPEEYDNILDIPYLHYLMSITGHSNNIYFDDNSQINYRLTDSILILRKLHSLLISDVVLVDSRDYDNLFNTYYKLCYYHNTGGYPGLIYCNKLDVIMNRINDTLIWHQWYTNRAQIIGYLINPSTMTYEIEDYKFRLTCVYIVAKLYQINLEVKIEYEIWHGPHAGTHLSVTELREGIGDYLQTGYLYVEESDLIDGYTQEEMEWRIKSYREQLERVKLL